MSVHAAAPAVRENVSWSYVDKKILAPMVRVGHLPFRMLCVRNGAGTLFSRSERARDTQTDLQIVTLTHICACLDREVRAHSPDIVYSDEIVDKKIIGATRKVNDELGTIDYFSKSGEMFFQTLKVPV
jgi:tRNA-dihydrouridine synthase